MLKHVPAYLSIIKHALACLGRMLERAGACSTLTHAPRRASACLSMLIHAGTCLSMLYSHFQACSSMIVQLRTPIGGPVIDIGDPTLRT